MFNVSPVRRGAAGAAYAVVFGVGACLAAARATADDVVGSPDVIGMLSEYRSAADDTLLDIALSNGLGYVELVAANPGVDPWLPGEGTTIVLPTAHVLPDAPRRGIVINLAAQRLYYFPSGSARVHTFPIGIGRAGLEMPLGGTVVVGKRAQPSWVPPPSIRSERPWLPAVVPPGPDNPLGDFALDLGWSGYVIHGTNLPYGIGRRVSHGCVRMHADDIRFLFGEIGAGAPVEVVDQPVKLGWRDGELYLEIHPSQAQADQAQVSGSFRPEPIEGLLAMVREAAGADPHRLDWALVARTAEERRGIPVRVTR
ncbi:MAG: L,D-transpeptidase family protein [Alphaproteobacteria bacterium]